MAVTVAPVATVSEVSMGFARCRFVAYALSVFRERRTETLPAATSVEAGRLESLPAAPRPASVLARRARLASTRKDG